MDNPLLEDWTAPFGAPPLDRIRPEHFQPAYTLALAAHVAEIAAIAADPAPPDFSNTIAALEKSGALLTRVDYAFGCLASSATNDVLQAVELELAPRLSQHWSAIQLNAALFARIDTVFQKRAALGLTPEEMRVLERYHLDFVRAGARLDKTGRDRLAGIAEQLAVLGTRFSQTVLTDEEDYVLPLTGAQARGLPHALLEACAATARARNVKAPYAVTLSRSDVENFLAFADDRAVREALFRAFVARGSHGGRDNAPLIARMLALRAEKARLLGYDSFAAYKLADSMAGTTERARALLDAVWRPARAKALKERAALQDLVAEDGGNFALAPWDWRYYAEKRRRLLFDFDDAALKPYFALDNMIAAAFFTAQRLFGLAFTPRRDVPVWHPDVRVWEVTQGGAPIGLFYGDYFARPGKQGGAWMSALRDQQKLGGNVTPLILNNCNFTQSESCLLGFDDAVTLFHEFGHALHGLLSQVTFPRLSGTNVARDFVELPSQLFEHWLEEPEVLTRFARHHETGAPIPADLLARLKKARTFNQGFATVEFLASAFIDMDFHAGEAPSDPLARQQATLEAIGMPDAIVPRHAAPHFTHVFGGDGYAAGYYAYLWSEVLDADGFEAFRQAKDPFDPALAARLHDFIYAAGGSRDYAQAYRDFRGRDPDIQALLHGRGLDAVAA
jgi:peptidyl-dipeptidase Dcp